MSNNGNMNVKPTFQFTPLVCAECGLPIGVIADRDIHRNINILCLYCAASLCLVNELLGTNFYISVEQYKHLFNKNNIEDLTFYRNEENQAWSWYNSVSFFYDDQKKNENSVDVVIE